MSYLNSNLINYIYEYKNFRIMRFYFITQDISFVTGKYFYPQIEKFYPALSVERSTRKYFGGYIMHSPNLKKLNEYELTDRIFGIKYNQGGSEIISIHRSHLYDTWDDANQELLKFKDSGELVYPTKIVELINISHVIPNRIYTEQDFHEMPKIKDITLSEDSQMIL